MKLRHYPAPILTQRCDAVVFPDRDVLLAREMVEFCRRCRGYALAAPQVGIAKRFFVIDTRKDETKRAPWFMANPEITGSDGSFHYPETCLSIPELYPSGTDNGVLKRPPVIIRPNRIGLRYQNEVGDWREFEASGLLGRVLWHELDHLNGELYLSLIAPDDRPRVEAVLRVKGLPVPWEHAVPELAPAPPTVHQTATNPPKGPSLHPYQDEVVRLAQSNLGPLRLP